MESKKVRKTRGTIAKISRMEIKEFKSGRGQLFKTPIQMIDSTWHSASAFSQEGISKILGDIKEGDNVTMTEVSRGGNFWDIAEIQVESKNNLIAEPKKDMAKVEDFKEKEADKYLFGQTINQVNDLICAFIGIKLDAMDSHDCRMSLYKEGVKELYEVNKKLRKEILGY